MTRVLVVTGTSTGVGQTVATAAMAATAEGSVVVVEPVQTGLADGDSDADEVHRLTGCAVQDAPRARRAARSRHGCATAGREHPVVCKL